MSSADQARMKASSFLSSGCDCARDPSSFARGASSQIKAAGRSESPFTSGVAVSTSLPKSNNYFNHAQYGYGGEQTAMDRQRASEIADASQMAYFDGLDQIKTSRQQNSQRQQYHSAALDEIYKSIGIKPRGGVD